MNNVRGLYPPLYGATANGGGSGGGGSIQVDTLPEASLEHKDKIVQYTGATTETLANGFFYKCVENTTYDWEETEASETYTEGETLPTASAETIGTIYKVDDKYYQTVIVLTYSWDNIPVMEVESGGIVLSENEIQIGALDGVPLYAKLMTFRTHSSYTVLPTNYKIQWYDAIFQRYASGVTYSHWYKGGNGYGNIEIDNATDGLTFYIENSSFSEVTVKLFIVYTKN